MRGAHLFSGAEARRSSPVEKKKENSTARARGHKRANTKGDIFVADVQELKILDASEIHARRLNAKDILVPKNGEDLTLRVAEAWTGFKQFFQY